MPDISFQDVSYTYNDRAESFLALEHIDLHVQDGEFVCLVGHSGCGKSTMLNLIAGLALPTCGHVRIDGQDVQGPGPDRSIVFQSYSLFPWQTALGNVTFAIRQTHRGMPKAQAAMRANELLERVGMAEAADRYPFQLSGGMRQRVAIARALGVDAPVMLLDEPFGALDPMIRQKLQNLLLELWDEAGASTRTAVFVTHDIDEALVLADRIVFMEPKHIVAEFALPPGREKTSEAIEADQGIQDIKREVMHLFDATSPERGQ